MLQAEIVRPGALAAQDEAAWRAMAAATPAFRSPLLSPEFARAVGEVRPDAAVALFRCKGELVGLLAHHRRPGGLARPIGAPWSDRHALITAPETLLDGREALTAAGLRAFRFSALLDPHGVFVESSGESEPETAYAIAPDVGGADYWESLRAASPKRFKNLRRLEHKLEREEGPVEFIVGDCSPTAFAELVRLKREQFARTGLHDVLHPAWSRSLMDNLFTAEPQGDFRGLLVTLRARGRVVASQFGVAGGGVYHPWLAAYDEAFAAFSPGLLFISAMIRRMPELGVDRYELSGGGDHYKTVFASQAEGLSRGEAKPGDGALRERRAGLAARVERRFENIVQAELTLGGRLQGMAQALAAMPRRLSPSSDVETLT